MPSTVITVRIEPGGRDVKNLMPSFLVVALLALAVSVCSACRQVSAPIPTELPEEPTPEDASLGDTQIRPADGMVMVYVPGGEFRMGSDDEEVDGAVELCNAYDDDCPRGDFADGQPAHTVVLNSLWIDRTEVTNGQYRQCVEAGACDPPELTSSYTRDTYYGDSAYDDYPVIYVSWRQAETYCEWAGARLPTEAEWEYAARGPEGRQFPWGDTFDGTKLNYCDANCYRDRADAMIDDDYADTAPVGSFADGASWCGTWDMAGNVWEWVADWYAPWYYGSSPLENPTGPPSGRYRAVRGGAWLNAPHQVRCDFRFMGPPDETSRSVGFRCVWRRQQ